MLTVVAAFAVFLYGCDQANSRLEKQEEHRGVEQAAQGEPTPAPPPEHLSGGMPVSDPGAPQAELGDWSGKWDTLIRGTSGADVLRGGPGDEVIADSYIPDKAFDRLYGGAGDDLLDAVSDPPLKDVVRCGPGEDEAQVDPEDDVGDDCEKADTIDLSKGPQPPKGTPKYLPAPGEHENKEVQVIDLKE